MSPITGVPNLWDLMPEVELMNNIRNKVHKKCNVHELLCLPLCLLSVIFSFPFFPLLSSFLPFPSSQIISWSMEKLSFTKPVPGAKRVGDCWSKGIWLTRMPYLLSDIPAPGLWLRCDDLEGEKPHVRKLGPWWPSTPWSGATSLGLLLWATFR